MGSLSKGRHKRRHLQLLLLSLSTAAAVAWITVVGMAPRTGHLGKEDVSSSISATTSDGMDPSHWKAQPVQRSDSNVENMILYDFDLEGSASADTAPPRPFPPPHNKSSDKIPAAPVPHRRNTTKSNSTVPTKAIGSSGGSVTKTYKFYDAGEVYHDMNFSCPVAWNWTHNNHDADAVWYNMLDHSTAPQNRLHSDQKLVFMSLESAAYYPQILDVKDRGFDFAVDYRIWPEHPAGPADIPAVYLTNPTAPDFKIDFRARPHFPKRTDAIMAVFISNCSPQNERNRVLEELMQLIPVHSYGGCMNNIEEPEVGPGLTRRQAKNKLAQQYYFIYTPENSNDHSYVSEKVYDGFDSGALPVYIGAPDIIRFIPDETSIINHSSFNSTADLAAYMKELVEDEEAYLTHFAWKQKPWSDDFSRVLRLASRTVQCRLAMHLEGLDFEEDLKHLDIFPVE